MHALDMESCGGAGLTQPRLKVVHERDAARLVQLSQLSADLLRVQHLFELLVDKLIFCPSVMRISVVASAVDLRLSLL